MNVVVYSLKTFCLLATLGHCCSIVVVATAAIIIIIIIIIVVVVNLWPRSRRVYPHTHTHTHNRRTSIGRWRMVSIELCMCV